MIKQETVDDLVHLLKTNKERYYQTNDILRLIPEIKNGQRLRTIVHHLRVNEHIPIISSGKGYCYSLSKEKLLENFISLQERSRSILYAAHALKEIHDEMDKIEIR